MSVTEPIQIVDLFAGPGGLGEGFSTHRFSCASFDTFEIKVSAEMETSAHSTLRLRAFYRLLRRHAPEYLGEYYRICAEGGVVNSLSAPVAELWLRAGEEALQLELGKPEDNAKLDCVLKERLDESKPWVLIGGPPCQAYSLVGRARNRGVAGYQAENDHRHFLYREYLRIIQQSRPAVFVMENVKGILSSEVGGQKIFPKILQDLSDPDHALSMPASGKRYKIFSLVSDDVYESCESPDSVKLSNYVICAEEYGVPQARHRVILLGVREDFAANAVTCKLRPMPGPGIDRIIDRLPRLRSVLTKEHDSPEAWQDAMRSNLDLLVKECRKFGANESSRKLLACKMEADRDTISGVGLSRGGLKVLKSGIADGKTDTHLDSWLLDDDLSFWLNHEARGHMRADLRRYAFAAAFAEVYHRSPKGHQDFDLPSLEPEHKNWKSGKFSDRFRVQRRGVPSSTITSHIAKDGHYFIHYDVEQCRSLTVREAARLQTFPDNYFFMGNRTQQFHQVGNAVPPYLAHQIADVVAYIISNGESIT